MRFYFHMRSDGDSEQDLDGIELASLEDAVVEARSAAREMIAEIVLQRERVGAKMFEITDERGLLLQTVRFEDILGLD